MNKAHIKAMVWTTIGAVGLYLVYQAGVMDGKMIERAVWKGELTKIQKQLRSMQANEEGV